MNIIEDLREYQSRVAACIPFERMTWALERGSAICNAVAQLQAQAEAAESLRLALRGLVGVIESAGLYQLAPPAGSPSNASWFVGAHHAVEVAREALNRGSE